MAEHRVQRRMAAVLAADVVGYSRLMGNDEEATLATLKRFRKVIDSLIEQHEGRVFGSAGDSVIAEFASPVEAVRCATDIQSEIEKRNADLREADRMQFRIGINLGDVLVDGSNLMGDGVNVAARLETLSSPGGICVSEAVFNQVRDRLPLQFLDLGENKLKNIARAVRAYRVATESEAPVKSPFRGLNVFDVEHASLFFGRAQAIGACMHRLKELAAGGKAFLLIYGSSGSGKSSLLRAGLLPSIMRPDAVPEILVWRHCVMRPSEAADPITSLAAGLLREGAFPELSQEIGATDLTHGLGDAPDWSLAAIRSALARAAKVAGCPASQARLVLAIDQLEELFTTAGEPSQHGKFVSLITTLARSGAVWVISNIRADFYHRCSEISGLSALRMA